MEQMKGPRLTLFFPIQTSLAYTRIVTTPISIKAEYIYESEIYLLIN